MSRSWTLRDLAEEVDGTVVGDGSLRLRGVATLEEAGPDDLSFLTNRKYRRAAEASRAGAILTSVDSDLQRGPRLEVDKPYLALATILGLFQPTQPHRPGISERAEVAAEARLGRDVGVGPFAVLEEDVELGDRVHVGAGCVVGRGTRIGDDTTLMPRVVLYPGTRVGRRCLIHAGVVLGADGFGFATEGNVHHKVPQIGRVVIEDDVEIGANSTIDRAAVGETRIGSGTKIDDLVMIAHGVRVGPAGLFAAQSGVAGSARLGAGVTIAGQSGVAGHLELADGTVVAAKSAVFDDIRPGAFVAGTPAIDHRRWKRAQASFARLPELRRELRKLRRRLDDRGEEA